MSTDPRFAADRFQAEAPERKKSGMSTCLMGCLIVFGIVVVLGIIAAIVIAYSWRGWTASLGAQVTKQAITESQLPEEEKVEINAQVDRIANGFRDGKISMEQLGELMQKFANSPLMTSVMASVIDTQYLEKSGLTPEEKLEGKKTLRRYLRGVVDHKIDQQGIDAAMVHVADKKANGQWEIRKQLSDDDLKKFLETAKAEADKAGIADEPENFDPSDEVKRIVDEALGGGAAPPAEMPK
jgi:hypothetical protein